MPTSRDSFRPVLAGALAVATLVAFGRGCVHGQVPRIRAVEEIRIGALEGPSALTHVSDLLLSPTGYLFVAQEMDREVRLYDDEGTLVRAFGGDGAGPGEFRSVDALGWVGDTLVVRDHAQDRFSLFEADGDFLRTLRVPQRIVADPGSPAGRVSVYATMLLPGHRVLGRRREGSETAAPVLVLDRDGWPVDTLDVLNIAGNIARFRGEAFTLNFVPPVPFGDVVVPDPRGRTVVVVRRRPDESCGPSHASITRIAGDGDTLFHHPVPFQPTPIADAVRDRLRAERIADLRTGKDGVPDVAIDEAVERALVIPRCSPAYSDVVVGIDDRIWLRASADDVRLAAWLVLGADGRPQLEVHLPAPIRQIAPAADHLWAVESDEYDVPYLVKYRLTSE